MAYASVALVPVNIWFLSIIGQTPGSFDQIFLGLIGVIRGRFLSVTSSAAHPRWPPSSSIRGQTPLIQKSRYGSHLAWISFLSIISPTPGSTGPICLRLIGGDWHDWRKVPFDDQCCRSFKKATTAPILDLVSIDYYLNRLVIYISYGYMTYHTT
jgi:hypothetical protein